jgi:cytidine deaminase
MNSLQHAVNRRRLFTAFGSTLALCGFRSDVIERLSLPRGQEPPPTLKPKSRQILDNLVHSSDFSGAIPAGAVEVLSRSEATSVPDLMIRLLALARTYSHAPISNYHVGAVTRGLSGSVYLGMNIEIPHHSLGFSVHGEQAALSNAYMHGENGVAAIAVTAAPCGHCRQFMNEMSPAGEIDILVQARAPLKLSSLLPMAFGPHDLGFQYGAFPVRTRKLALPARPEDELVRAAHDAAEHAYAPYSRSASGVAVRTKTGRIYKGSYLENAAFNPSLSPLQTALVQLILAGEDYAAISQTVLVEIKDAKISQASVTAAVLNSIAPRVDLQTIPVEES